MRRISKSDESNSLSARKRQEARIEFLKERSLSKRSKRRSKRFSERKKTISIILAEDVAIPFEDGIRIVKAGSRIDQLKKGKYKWQD